MQGGQFEARLRSGEQFHTLTVPPGAWTVLRVDGRGFSTFTEQHYRKPFDEQFNEHMTRTAQALLTEFDARAGDRIACSWPRRPVPSRHGSATWRTSLRRPRGQWTDAGID